LNTQAKTVSPKECMVGFKRRLVFWLALAVLGSTLSGCVVRPLGWGHHGYHEGDRYEGGARQQRDEGRRDDGRRGDWR
jgi:hypothetical protein